MCCDRHCPQVEHCELDKIDNKPQKIIELALRITREELTGSVKNGKEGDLASRRKATLPADRDLGQELKGYTWLPTGGAQISLLAASFGERVCCPFSRDVRVLGFRV